MRTRIYTRTATCSHFNTCLHSHMRAYAFAFAFAPLVGSSCGEGKQRPRRNAHHFTAPRTNAAATRAAAVAAAAAAAAVAAVFVLALVLALALAITPSQPALQRAAQSRACTYLKSRNVSEYSPWIVSGIVRIVLLYIISVSRNGKPVTSSGSSENRFFERSVSKIPREARLRVGMRAYGE